MVSLDVILHQCIFLFAAEVNQFLAWLVFITAQETAGRRLAKLAALATNDIALLNVISEQIN